jgi:hypothetical protein
MIEKASTLARSERYNYSQTRDFLLLFGLSPPFNLYAMALLLF